MVKGIPLTKMGFADEIGILIEAARPVGVADDRELRVVILVGRVEGLTEGHGYAKGGEEISADGVSLDVFRDGFKADSRLVLGERDVGDDIRENGAIFPEAVVDVNAVYVSGVAGAANVGRHVGVREVEEPTGIVHGEHAEEDGMHDAEDGGVGADAEGERGNDGDSKTGRHAQASNRKSKVLDDRSHALSPLCLEQLDSH